MTSIADCDISTLVTACNFGQEFLILSLKYITGPVSFHTEPSDGQIISQYQDSVRVKYDAEKPGWGSGTTRHSSSGQ